VFGQYFLEFCSRDNRLVCVDKNPGRSGYVTASGDE
jgi:hypothetical protein